MRSPDPLMLEALVAVADRGSVSAAARALGVTQPSASRMLSQLEQRLGLTLLVRSTSGSRLTGPGLAVVEWARQVLEAYQRLESGASMLAPGPESPLLVAASQTVAEHLLPRWLTRLRQVSPETVVNVAVTNSDDVLAQVMGGEAQLGFTEGPGRPAGVRSSPVGQDDLVLVVAPGHPWATRTKPVTPDELAWTPLIVRETWSGTRTALEATLPTTSPPALETTSNAAVRVAVASGLAPAVLSRLAVADALAARTLVEVPYSTPLLRTLRVIWTGPRQLHGTAATLAGIARSVRTKS